MYLLTLMRSGERCRQTAFQTASDVECSAVFTLENMIWLKHGLVGARDVSHDSPEREIRSIAEEACPKDLPIDRIGSRLGVSFEHNTNGWQSPSFASLGLISAWTRQHHLDERDKPKLWSWRRVRRPMRISSQAGPLITQHGQQLNSSSQGHDDASLNAGVVTIEKVRRSLNLSRRVGPMDIYAQREEKERWLKVDCGVVKKHFTLTLTHSQPQPHLDSTA
ncbi:hypothetical protein CROQUDRAFT_90428 [Cronartium quercuum f. sp. fusiforme G11]|uniref:Uncharacterized protein n=1 Tax=Cronartium quercuum f. sp. fusiforme G11 TaxID=708437 RepID=A0A9P6NLS5_9BASI|nr:hypothetical protein CROQUDRAFT_90428 [Cronartium quercuum f. sp. fusiforme G11]